MKHKDLRPWLSVIAGGESLVSHAGGLLLVETARRSGLAGQLSRLLGPWRRPMAVHDPGKIVTDLAIAVALGGDAACDIAVLRAQPGVFGHGHQCRRRCHRQLRRPQQPRLSTAKRDRNGPGLSRRPGDGRL